jgi:hypothetical protein
VWNPSIEEFKVIPPNQYGFVPPDLRVVSKLHGFGYDYNGDDYKLIQYVKFCPVLQYMLDARLNVLLSMSLSKMICGKPFWEIYSLKSKSWKKLNLDMPTYSESRGGVLKQVYTKGICHWLCERENIDNIVFGVI